MICEKCWADAYLRALSSGRPQYEEYKALLLERADNPCPPEIAQGNVIPEPGSLQTEREGRENEGESMTFPEWEKLPEAQRNAEAATVVMGWRKIDWGTDGTLMAWVADGSCPAQLRKFVKDFRPCTDRNATDMLLAEVERRGRQSAFDYVLGCESDDAYHAIRSGSGHAGSALGILRIDPSLLTWACVEACREEA